MMPPGARLIPDPDAEVERLAALRKPQPGAGWQCPGCRTWYSPDVQECRCEADRRSFSERLRQEPAVRFGDGAGRLPEVTW